MSSRDFLHKDAETHLSERFIAAGAICSFSTNCEQVCRAARESFLPANSVSLTLDFSVRFWVDEADRSQPPWPKPYVRGLDHLVFAGFDAGSSMLADLRTRRVVGRFSPGMAEDTAYWKTVIFPILLTVVGASVGIAELHCACVAKDQEGLLLAGPSGSGKSTLALALAQIGYGFLSDDRTFCSLNNGKVQAWGLPTRLKLRPEAAGWFQGLRAGQPSGIHAVQGDLWVDTEHSLGLKHIRHCRPRALVFLDRSEKDQFRWNPISSAEALSRVETEMMAELPDAIAKRSQTIEKLVGVPCWLLEYGGRPQNIAEKISKHLERS